jgi:hypothetical protein
VPKEFTGLFRSSFDTYVVVDRGDGTKTTLPKRVYIAADYRPSYDLLPVLPDEHLEDEGDA